jgi:nucleotide-binding universal stress UspA family protein
MTGRSPDPGGDMFRRILAPVDGSTFSEHGLRYAVHAAILDDGVIDLVLVHVSPRPVSAEMSIADRVEAWEADQKQQESDYLHALADRLRRDFGVQVRPALREGDVVTALERMVDEQESDLVVLTTHGRAGIERAWLGSVADALLRRLDVPLLLVRPADDEPVASNETGVDYSHVVIALDGSDRAERALAPAIELAGSDARITLLRAVAPPSGVTSPYLPHAARLSKEELARREAEARGYLDAVSARLAESGCTATPAIVLDYHEAHAILQYAVDNDADLIAMSTHGHRPVTRLIVGSVTDKVVRAADVPVLVC